MFSIYSRADFAIDLLSVQRFRQIPSVLERSGETTVEENDSKVIVPLYPILANAPKKESKSILPVPSGPR